MTPHQKQRSGGRCATTTRARRKHCNEKETAARGGTYRPVSERTDRARLPVEGVFTALLPELQRAVGDRGYARPTPIQTQAIPHLLEGRDLYGCAQRRGVNIVVATPGRRPSGRGRTATGRRMPKRSGKHIDAGRRTR